MQEQKKTTGLGIFFLLLTAVVWGFAFVAQTVGSDHVGAFLFNGIRFALGGISLLPVIALFEKKNPDPASHKQLMRTTVTAGIVCGILLCSASTLQQYGIELFQRAGFPDSSGRAGFLTALYMVLVPLFNLFTGKKAGLFTWIGVGFAAIGLFLVSVSSAFTISPQDLVVLGCAVLFAAHILVIDRFGDGLYSLRFSMIQFFVCAVVSFIAWGISIVTGLHTAESFSDLKGSACPDPLRRLYVRRRGVYLPGSRSETRGSRGRLRPSLDGIHVQRHRRRTDPPRTHDRKGLHRLCAHLSRCALHPGEIQA